MGRTLAPMFDRLSESFSSAFRKLRGKGKITEANIRETMADVRTALLEADVDYALVNEFCERVVEDALGQEVLKSLDPDQQMVGIVHRALVEMIGGGEEGAADAVALPRVSPPPTIIMMCGLQGSGKTTTCGKLAAFLRKKGRSVMLAAADLQRPAAVEQLETIAGQLRSQGGAGGPAVEFYAEPDKVAEYGRAVGVAVRVCQNAVKAAQRAGVDTLILDTAGRLHINDDLMKELEGVRAAVRPHAVLLVADAMTGQDAVQSAGAFHRRLGIDGVILSKFDSDTRGGAAISIRKVTGAPIRFIGTGERLDALEVFHAERVAGRILGMGDVVSLVEKAQEEVSEAEAEQLAEKMSRGELTMDDFLKQMRTLRRMGPMKQLLGMLPGVGAALKNIEVDEKQLDRLEGIVHSMTPDERRDVKMISTSRKKRIAKGSGTKFEDVSRFITQFQAMARMTKQMAGMGVRDKMRAVKEMQALGAGGGLPGIEGMPGLGGSRGSTFMESPKKRFKQRKKK